MAQDLLPQGILIDTACEAMEVDTIQALVDEWNLPHTPFIALHLPEQTPVAQPVNVSGYLMKPFTVQKLSEALYKIAVKPRRILVIDDDQDFVRLLSRFLDNPQRQSQVIGAYNGRDGLALLDTTQPDLILVDFDLPEWPGPDLVTAIRARRSGKKVPIVAILPEEHNALKETINQPLMVTRCPGLEPGRVARLIQYFMGLPA
jgi:CheY-like chemotaxis protein